MSIHIFNLSQNITVESLEILLGSHGQVVSASLFPEQDAFIRKAIIKMSSEIEDQVVIARLHGSVIDGRMISAQLVSEN